MEYVLNIMEMIKLGRVASALGPLEAGRDRFVMASGMIKPGMIF